MRTGKLLAVLLLLAAVGVAVCLAAGCGLFGGVQATDPIEGPPDGWQQPEGDALHAPLTALLQAHVDDSGMVDYEGLRGKRGELDAYLDALNWTKPESLGDADRLAYWINAYNAYTLRLILDHYDAIKDKTGIRDIPAAQRWKAVIHPCGGVYRSLDEMEHEILRVQFDEPRIHFAINCASYSCPLLRAEAYLGSRVDAQLADATQRFLADRARGIQFPDGGVLKLSQLFTWFRADFVRSHDSVTAFIVAHAGDETKAKVQALGGYPSIDYLDYDWSLNRQS